MKWVFRIFVVVVLLFILALLFLPGTIARPIAERVASNKMKVDVGIGGLSASVFSSSVGLSGLDVGNPEGFDSDKMMSVKEIKAQANIMSFLTSVIEIPSVNLDGLDMLIENKGFKNNVKTLMNNLKGEGGEGDAESSGEGKKFKIDKIVITNAKVTFKTGVVPAASVTIDELVVEDIGTSEGMGVNLSQVIEAVISALAKKSFDLAGDLPEGIRKALMEGGMLEAIDKGVVDKIKSGGKNLIDGVKNIFD